MSERQGLGSCQYDENRIMILGGYAQGVFNDESFLLDVEKKTVEKISSLPIECFPFAMPTLCDSVNQIAYTVDWSKFKILKF